MSGFSGFAAALTAPDGSVPVGVTAPDGSPSSKRFSVYRNNRASTLIEALSDNFPLCQAIVGERFFEAMAQVFAREHPPTSPILFHFGQDFAAFADAFEPAESVPYLADVARLEWAWLQAFHARDVTPTVAASMSRIEPEALEHAFLTLHPALTVLRSSYPVVSIVARLRAGSDLKGLDMAENEDALITRPGFEVELRQLPPGAYEFITNLQTHKLGETVELMATVEGFDLSTNLAALFEVGGVAAISMEAR
ncbi:DNA-binding domain-containing protein [Rhizobiaceae bacterium]|nr:DNA-binding domain-containing protein [Rhizobiaceae bacterium]